MPLHWNLGEFSFVPRGGAFDIAARFHCRQSTTSFVSTLSRTKENQPSVHARLLPAIVLLIFSIVSRPDRANFHSLRGQQDGVSQGTSEEYFFSFGPFSAAVLFPKSCKMVAVWKNNTLASLNAQIGDEERHSAHGKFRPVARGNDTKSSCFVGNTRCLLASEQPIYGRIELAARWLTRARELCFIGGRKHRIWRSQE